MLKIQNNQVRISVSAGDEDAIFICRRPTTRELSKFLNSRFTTVRNKAHSRVYEAREEFMRQIAVDLENVTFVNARGETLPLNAATVLTPEDKEHWGKILNTKVESWIDMVSLSWLSSAAMYFEDSNGASESEEGN